MLVRLSHPYQHSNTGEVLDLTDSDARALIAQGGAKAVDDLVVHVGGGWFDVELHNPVRHVRVQGHDAAIDALRANADDE